MAKKASSYNIDFIRNTIIISKDFAKRAQDFESQENKMMNHLLKTYPKMEIVSRTNKTARKKNNPSAKLTYVAMEKYMRCFPSAALYLKKFKSVKDLSVAQGNRYLYVKKWFMATFPNYQDLPTFDAQGNIQECVNWGAGERFIEAAKQAA